MASSSGDMRTALAICRRALELARIESESVDNFGSKSTDGISTIAHTLTPLQKRIMSSPSVRMSLRSKSRDGSSKVAEKKPIVLTIRHINQAIQETRVIAGFVSFCVHRTGYFLRKIITSILS